MSDALERANQALAKARTTRQRDTVLRNFYAEDSANRSGDDLFEYNLMKLETVASHLAVMSYARPNLVTIRKTSLTTGIEFYLEAIDAIIAHDAVTGYEAITPIWDLTRDFLAALTAYKGEHGPLHQGIWLAHRGAKLMLELWRESKHLTRPSMYYSQEEENFSLSLPTPITKNMSLTEQNAALMMNFESCLKQLR